MILKKRALSIVSSTFLPMRLDFRMTVVHGLAARHHTINIFVEVESGDGLFGYGECVPRKYVTGETPESVLSALTELLPQLSERTFSSCDDVLALLKQISESDIGSRNPAAFCALELAVIDLTGKHWGIPASEVLSLERGGDYHTYSLVVPQLPEPHMKALLERSVQYNIGQVKLKVNADDSIWRVGLARDILGPGTEIRIDANCTWNIQDGFQLMKSLGDMGVVSVEEPLQTGNLEGLSQLRKAGGMLITLDESVSNPDDVKRIADAGAADIINVRVSKCGGLTGSLGVIKAAEENGIGVQLGAQVGESCILSAAGAQLAAVTPSFRWLEGFFGTHLLVKDLCCEDIRLGCAGRLDQLTGPGLGVDVARSRVDEANELYLSMNK